MDVAGEALLDGVLDDLAEGRAGIAQERLLAAWETAPGPTVAALAAVASFWRGDFATAVAWSRLADEDAAPDPATRALVCAAAALAAAGDPNAAPEARWREGVALLAGVPDDRPWAAVRYLLAEAALVSANLLDARAVLASGPPPALAWEGRAFAAMMRACEVRVAAFSGDITLAEALLDPMRRAVAPGSRLSLVVEAVAALVHGNADDEAGVRRLVTLADVASQECERDFVDRGVLLLLAFGCVAIGDVAGAARLMFRAGDDGDLTSCTVIDRALGFEMLLTAALDEDDLPAAETWLAALDGLADCRIAAPAVLRARARSLLTNGEPAAAAAAAEASVAVCRTEGRVVEAAEGEIVLARARIALADIAGANRDLRALVTSSDATGHRAVRRSATSALQFTGRRLPPMAGGGWAVLSDREAEVARLVLQGLDIDEVAARLYLSRTTVRSHVSRVLAAFAVPTRIGLLTVAGGAARAVEAAGAARAVPVLSPRQEQVAALVAAGRSNQQIADELGISVKGVEKHVGDVLSRWSARSRFDIARTWLAARGTPDVEDAGAAGAAGVPTTPATSPPTTVPAPAGDRSMADDGPGPR